MGEMAFQIISSKIVNSTVYSSTDQRKYQCSASLAFVTGEFPTKKASNAENASIWWRHHGYDWIQSTLMPCDQQKETAYYITQRNNCVIYDVFKIIFLYNGLLIRCCFYQLQRACYNPCLSSPRRVIWWITVTNLDWIIDSELHI